jgi:1-acyl-sn-glycerol-3-phosphate acyltransferase
MKRIVMMVIRMFFQVPYYVARIWWCGVSKKISYEKGFQITQRATKKANRAGRVTIQAIGCENLPEKNGFMLYPNHQGLFDVLVFLESCPKPFAFVIKKEASKVILLKQVIAALGSISIDRKDLKQSMEVINLVSEEIKKGRNFLIFPEGTRSKQGNTLLPFKGGSFKVATKSKCPIVPCALIDSFKPFDENTIQPVTVTVLYLTPIYYEEYQTMKTNEIADLVRERITVAIQEFTELKD